MKKRYVLGAVVIGCILVVVFNSESPNDRDKREATEAADWKADIVREKANLAAKIKASPGDYSRTMDCAAKRVSDETVEAHYQTFLIHRPDLVSSAQRERMVNQWLDAIQQCGGDLGALTVQMQNDPDDLVMKGLTVALVRQDR